MFCFWVEAGSFFGLFLETSSNTHTNYIQQKKSFFLFRLQKKCHSTFEKDIPEQMFV